MGTYYELTKSGIVYGNAITALAAFLFASNGTISLPLLAATIVGLSLSIAASCVVNNVIDRDIDAHMERTRNRALVTGKVSVRSALIFAAVLGMAGFSILYFFTNIYAFLVTAFGVLVYLFLYTPAKRVTPHSTIIGAFAGAVPPVVGYVAVLGVLDMTALLLFLILVCWQMTHFFAIGIFRMDEYRAAKLPIMTVRMGITKTKVLMVLYAILFTWAALSLAVVESLWFLYTIPMTVVCLGWILLSLEGFRTKHTVRWARTTFFYSLVVLLLFSLLLAVS